MRSILATVFLVVAIAYMPSEAAQQRGGMRDQAPRYDTATEVTVSGTVQEIKQVTGGMGMRNVTGTHVILTTDQETVAPWLFGIRAIVSGILCVGFFYLGWVRR